VKSLGRLLLGGMAGLGMAPLATAQQRLPPPQLLSQQGDPLHGAVGERMQKNHNADQSIEQQVRRLTRNLDPTSEQQEKVRQLSRAHNDRIQTILDAAPPMLTREAFSAQVHAISQETHDAVNAILTPHQLELMKAIVSRLDNGKEGRHAP